MDFRTEEIGLKVASALLIRKKEIAVSDLQAMPFFTDSDQVKNAVEYLLRTFDARMYSKRVARHPMLEWEDVISLRQSDDYEFV